MWRRHGRDVNSCDIRSHEHYGIKKIKDLSTRYPRDKLLYFHSKGVTRRASSEDWVSYMEHFCRADIPWRRVAAALRRGNSVATGARPRYSARDERTGRLMCDPTPKQRRVLGDAEVDPSRANARRLADDSVTRLAYNHRIRWASLEDFDAERALGDQIEVLDAIAKRVLNLREALREAPPVCFVHVDAPRMNTGGSMNCPLSGEPLGADSAGDLAACCDTLAQRGCKSAPPLIVHFATTPPDAAHARANLVSVDKRLMDDPDAGGALRFLIWAAGVGGGDD